jgi:hypothetical protein
MTIVRQGVAALDWKYIHKYFKELAALKEDPTILEQLDALRTKYDKQ